MNKNHYRNLILSVFALIILFNAGAQVGKNDRKRVVSSKSRKQSLSPYGNVPIEMMPANGGFKPVKWNSDAKDVSIQKKDEFGTVNGKKINLADILFRQRVWQEIDIREQGNAAFSYKDDGQGLDAQFINVLVDAIRTKKAIAYSNEDDRFTRALSSSEFENLLKGNYGCDTMPVYDLMDPTRVEKYIVSCRTLEPNDIVKFRIKEDWILDKETCELHKFISGIAPLQIIYSADGKERGTVPLFWVYYPDLKSTLAHYNAYDPANMIDGKTTWRDVFENRMFSSSIIKTTYKNPLGLYLKQMDPAQRHEILELFDGDNIRERIFSYGPGPWLN